MLRPLAHAIEARDPATRGHGARVTALAQTIAVRLGWDDARIDALRLGARLHDVGKLAISARVLTKPGPLDELELRLVQTHPLVGARMVRAISSGLLVLPYVLYHHERWDGAGYPTGRAGEDIPVEGRVLAVADAYDAMTSNRPYRCAVSADEALEEVERCAGTQFDPAIARLFVDALAAGRLPVAS
jgi:HD-GYP domain-containing protein (c-di-GMP phosphodiesterase class II)